MIKILLIACILITSSLKADIRILELLPNLTTPLAIDPYLPEDFVAASPTGTLTPSDWIYWGPKEVLEAYFKDKASLKQPIIRVTLSANTAQKTTGSFFKDEGFEKLMKLDPHSTWQETKWGDYPVYTIKIKFERCPTTRIAWVGLNDPQTGWMLMFDLINPFTPIETTDTTLWDNFINKTIPLTGADFFKALGQDLRPGYTHLNTSGAKLKIVAEKRTTDGALQVTILPETPNLEYRYKNMTEGLMTAEWKHGMPLVKVYGEIQVSGPNWKNIIQNVTSIFPNPVTEFTYNKDTHPLTFQKASTN